jgi:hypothetical protein
VDDCAPRRFSDNKAGAHQKGFNKIVVQRRLFLCNMLHLIRCPLNGNLNGGLEAIVNGIRSNRPTAQPNG